MKNQKLKIIPRIWKKKNIKEEYRLSPKILKNSYAEKCLAYVLGTSQRVSTIHIGSKE